MKITQRFLPMMVMAISFGVHSEVSSAGILYLDESLNTNLVEDSYYFAGAHSAGSTFLDELQFSLDAAGDITASVNNSVITPPNAPGPVPNLLNNSFLTVSLFDNLGNFVAAAGAGGTLSATGLSSGITYTLAVSGKASGIFGGVYDGNLTVNDAPAVPLPSALPAFLSALLVLGWRPKKSIQS